MTYDPEDPSNIKVVGRDVPYPPLDQDWPEESRREVAYAHRGEVVEGSGVAVAPRSLPTRITESSHSPQNRRREAYRAAMEASGRAHQAAFETAEWLSSVNDPMATGWWKLVDRLADRADRLSEQLDRL